MTRLAALAAVGAAVLGGMPARAEQDVVFLSTQLRPIEEAQKMRKVILKDFPHKVTYLVDEPPQFDVRMRAETEGGKRTISLAAALHGEIASLPASNFEPIDDVAAKLAARGIPTKLMELGKLGTGKQIYVPWTQATYVMVARKEALQYLPAGAEVNTLTYDQLEAWAKAITERTRKRVLGFPAGPKGLLHRFFQGYLYPSFTGGLVSPFRSAEAEVMWTRFKGLWQYANPSSTSYDFMQEPLLSGEVWIAFDHVARLKEALLQSPNEFVAFPAPAGPKGRAYMPAIAGLAIAKGAPNRAGAAALIEYLTRPEIQARVAAEVAFFPVAKVDLPPDLAPGLRMLANAVTRSQESKDALVSLIPMGLGEKSGEFNKVFTDTFQRIVLRGEAPRAVLDAEAEVLKGIMATTRAPCWSPDKPSQGACPVH